MMDKIEAWKAEAKTKRDILAAVAQFKHEVDGLLARDFFKQLLTVYSDLSKWQGTPNWFNLYGIYLENPDELDDPECEECTSGKMRLLEKLIFYLNESEVLQAIDNLAEAKAKYLIAKQLVEDSKEE